MVPQPLVNFLAGSYAYFGLAGCAIICLVSIVTGLSFSGRNGERYSVFNHFISELGELGVSTRAQVFNWGLIFSGIILIPFVLGLGVTLGGVWAVLGSIAGVVTAVACSCVGIFPVNNISGHAKAAMTYFRGGLLMVLFFSIAVMAQPAERVVISKWVALFGLLSVAAFAAFLILVRGRSVNERIADMLDPAHTPQRPRFWALAAVEWSIFFSTLVWFLGVALIGLK
jgi:hypothetical protein